jgi:chaperonin cofactor prefoldin
MAQKINSQQFPRIPLITITNAQKCPCLRRGCQCNYDNSHPFHEALLSPPANISVVDALKETIERLESHVASSNKREKELREGIRKIRMVSSEQKGQLLTEVKVGKATITAVIDSGADINYVNEQWCKEEKIPYRMTGWGWIKSYKGEKTRTKILEADIKIRVQGKFSRAKFTVLKETGDDKLVLGIPWLEKANPSIDWKNRTITFHGISNGEDASRKQKIGIVGTEYTEYEGIRKSPSERKGMVRVLPTIEEDQEEVTPRMDERNERPEKQVKHSAAYFQELKDIQSKLPAEVKEFADVFCTED